MDKEQDNIFKWLRQNRTEKIVMQGEGKKIPVKKPLSTEELAKGLHISKTTVRDAEKAEDIADVSMATVRAYHDYFHILYSTLFGELDIKDMDNLNIHMELELTDDSISSIKDLSPIALAMLNTFMGKDADTENFFYRLADITFSMIDCLKRNGNDKNDIEYQTIRNRAGDLFMDYMHTFHIIDFKKILIQIEQQQIEMEEQLTEQMHEAYMRYFDDFNASNAREEYEKERIQHLKDIP